MPGDEVCFGRGNDDDEYDGSDGVDEDIAGLAKGDSNHRTMLLPTAARAKMAAGGIPPPVDMEIADMGHLANPVLRTSVAAAPLLAVPSTRRAHLTTDDPDFLGKA